MAVTAAAQQNSVPVAKKKRANRQPIDPNETKDQRFRRLANRRVPRALRYLAHVRSLANKQNYEYTPEQVKKIVDALQASVISVRETFAGNKQAAETFSV